MPAVVVTGASGFIGRAVCVELLRRGVTVYGIGRMKHASIPGVIYSCVAEVAEYDTFQAPPHSICLHLAGSNDAAQVVSSIQEELGSSLKLARKIANQNFSRVIFSSSALVYGDHEQTPRREDDTLCPIGVYARIKAAAEEVFLTRGHSVARLANVYGPGMSTTNLFADVLKQIPGKEDIHVRSLTPVRDYIHVADVARGLADLALGATTGVFNLGTGSGMSVSQLVTWIARYAGEEWRLIVQDTTNNQQSTLILDPTKMNKTFGWKAAILLPEGLKELVENRLKVVSM